MKRLSPEDKAGLYVTVIVHLVVIIVLLCAGLGYSLQKENSFVLDFSKAESLEKLEKEMAFQKDINDKLNRMLREEGVGTSPVRNVAVNRGALKDDRGTDAKKLYEDARRLQEDLENTFGRKNEDYVEPPVIPGKENKKETQESSYSGPSVVSYDLGGRKASKLPIPAYRCFGAGTVKVLITVDPQGNVLMAKVDESASSTDGCLRSFAIRAARMSKFTIDNSAPPRQAGNIVYEFIAQ